MGCVCCWYREVGELRIFEVGDNDEHDDNDNDRGGSAHDEPSPKSETSTYRAWLAGRSPEQQPPRSRVATPLVATQTVLLQVRYRAHTTVAS